MAHWLPAFQKQHGTTIVWAHHGQDRPLAHWVIWQWSQHGKYVLTEQAKGHHLRSGNNYDSLVMHVLKRQGETGEYFRKLSHKIIAARICHLVNMGWDPLEHQWMEI
jgi:hypothetical protein